MGASGPPNVYAGRTVVLPNADRRDEPTALRRHCHAGETLDILAAATGSGLPFGPLGE